MGVSKRIVGAMAITVIGLHTAFAAPPAAINLHGQLLSASGAPVTGLRTFTVQFHDASAAGNTLGTALTGTVDVSADGLFDLVVTPPSQVLTATEVWYSLGVDTDDPVDAARIGHGSVDNSEFEARDGVTGGVQAQIDAIDTSGIATNAAAITQLQTDVSAKTDSADVYAKTESDANFVAVAGSPFFNGALIDFKVNGSSRIQGGATTLQADTVSTPTLTSSSFAAGNVLTFHINSGLSELQDISMVLVVEC